MNTKTFRIGDRVAVKDQSITGTIIALSPTYATIADDDWRDWSDQESCEQCENRLEFRLDDLLYRPQDE